jgi:hypothetical protein
MWLHEIKHDDFRVTARKEGKLVKLYSRSYPLPAHRKDRRVHVLNGRVSAGSTPTNI